MKTMTSAVAIYRAAIPQLVDLYVKAATTIPSPEAIAHLEASAARRSTRSGNVAVIPLHGVILRRPGVIEQLLGAASLDAFMGSFRAAAADPDIGTIVLDIDSPGGTTDGIPEAAAEIRATRERKPVVAVADTMAASAAFWLGSQASEFVAMPSAILGAIGVYHVHNDVTAALEAEGVKRDIIASSDLKASFAPGAPLTKEAREQLEALVSSLEGMFVNDVAKGRGVPVSTVRSDFGKGGILAAAAAKAAGMVDRVDTFGATLARALPRRSMAVATNSVTVWGGVSGTVDVNVIDLPPEPVPTPDPEPARLAASTDELALRRYRARARTRR